MICAKCGRQAVKTRVPIHFNNKRTQYRMVSSCCYAGLIEDTEEHLSQLDTALSDNRCERCRNDFQSLKEKIVQLTKNNLEHKSIGWEEREQAFRSVIHAMSEVEKGANHG